MRPAYFEAMECALKEVEGSFEAYLSSIGVDDSIRNDMKTHLLEAKSNLNSNLSRDPNTYTNTNTNMLYRSITEMYY